MMDSKNTEKVLTSLRLWMRQTGLQGYWITTADEHLSEHTPLHARRLEWLTGFSGSYGMALILQHAAALLVDGRYTLQAQNQVDVACMTPIPLQGTDLRAWLAQQDREQGVIGYNPWIMSQSSLQLLQSALDEKRWSLRPEKDPVIDQLWADRPLPTLSPLCQHPLVYAGEDSLQKRTRLWKTLHPSVQTVVVADVCSLAWLLNLRASDVPYTPVALMYGMVHRDLSVDVFIDLEKRPMDFDPHSMPDVRWHPYADFREHLETLDPTGTIQCDAGSCPVAIMQTLDQKGIPYITPPDPLVRARACKNPVETQGARHAHLKDGVALVKFFAWLYQTFPHQNVTELDVVHQLELCRQQGALYQGPSFSTIAASGPHGAIIHYMPTPESNRALKTDELFLLDSGGQYLEGTTDVTRTFAFSPPTPAQKAHFTAVLKGHIALARAVFPQGTSGAQLDALARQPVWRMGWEYNHGTGHGVGSYLSVHEGPHSISKRASTVPLQEGMLVSNEPGLYAPGSYGIRIESVLNVIQVQDASWVRDATQPSMLGFETLTLAPIDRLCIEKDLLNPEEQAWLNTYHRRVYETLRPYLGAPEVVWLEQATQPL